MFPRIAEVAEKHEVMLAFENCPMYEFWPPIHNIAVSPELHEIGYDGVISTEHEDPIWTGTDEKVQKGLLLAKRHLEQFI